MSYHIEHCSNDPLDRMTGLIPDQYHTEYHKTPTKRKYEEVHIDDYDSVVDHGYYSQSPVYSHGSHHKHRGDSGLCGRCCQDDAGLRCPPRDQFTGYAWQTHHSTLRNIYETPTKTACCQRRRCYTDTKHLESIHRPSHCTVPKTCLKSRKRLCFDSSNHERQTDSSSEFKFSHVRDLRYDIESLDVRSTPKSEFCVYNLNNEGPRIQSCRTPAHQATTDRQMPVCNSPLQALGTGTSNHQRQNIHRNRHTAKQAANSARSCKCADLKQGFVTLAANAFMNIRRKDSSAESFQQFKTEVDRTNEFLKQTLEMLSTFQDLCGH